MRLKNIIVVSTSTILSRVLGLLRDALTVALLGVSAINSAFIFAFTIPNLFRRLLGEGALTSALIPVFSEEIEKKGKAAGFQFVNQALSWALLIFVGITALGMAMSYSLYKMEWLEGRYHLGMQYLTILFPYMLCVCLSALITAILNVLNRFGAASLSQVWLNCTMVGSLGLAIFWHKDAMTTALYLCYGVIAGALAQILVPSFRLYKMGWRPRLNLNISASLKELVQLLLPGIAGASVFQINIVVSRFLAFSINDEGISILYIANRLIELPLGIFAIAISTVLFPEIARLVAQNKQHAIGKTYIKGLRLIFIIMIPAAVGLIVLSEPILRILFEWGHFTEENVLMTQPILMITAIGLPFYGMSNLSTKGLHGLKDMRTPYRVAIKSFLINAFLSIVLGHLLGINGIALANLIAATYQAFSLHWKLTAKNIEYEKLNLSASLIKITIASSVMAITAFGIYRCMNHFIEYKKLADALTVMVGIGIAIIVYLLTLYWLGMEEKEELKKLFNKLNPKTEMSEKEL